MNETLTISPAEAAQALAPAISQALNGLSGGITAEAVTEAARAAAAEFGGASPAALRGSLCYLFMFIETLRAAPPDTAMIDDSGDTGIDGIAQVLAEECIEKLRRIVARATPEAVLVAALAQAREAGSESSGAVRSALMVCLGALDALAGAVSKPTARAAIAGGSADTEGGVE